MWRNVLALAAGGVYGQEVARTGTLAGFITDPTGLGVSGVEVTAVNQETKFTSKGLTNETGRYSIPYLNPGTYEMRLAVPGFKTYVRNGIELLAGESPRIDVQMELGGRHRLRRGIRRGAAYRYRGFDRIGYFATR